MNQFTVGSLLVLGSLSAIYADLPAQMQNVFDDSLQAVRQVATAGDMHSMAVMLDAAYVMDRRLPREDEFAQWLRMTFKKNNVKGLDVDAWGNAYSYTLEPGGRSYRLQSAGPDHESGTDDDMTVEGP